VCGLPIPAGMGRVRVRSPPLAIGLTLMYGNRTGKLRVRVYLHVGLGMGRNFQHGSGAGTGSIIGYGYWSDS